MHDYRSPSLGPTPGPSGKPASATIQGTGSGTPTVGTPLANGQMPNGKAEMYRIVLLPTSEMMHADIEAKRLDPEQALRLEARLLQITTPPLCLDPSLECLRIANSMYRSSMILPTKDDPSPPGKKLESALSPASALKRSRNGVELSEEAQREEKERKKRQKLMHVMDEAWQRPFAPTCVVLIDAQADVAASTGWASSSSIEQIARPHCRTLHRPRPSHRSAATCRPHPRTGSSALRR